jgi:hypothetical protein
MEQALRNGVILVKLARFFAPTVISERHIFDEDEKTYRVRPRVCCCLLACVRLALVPLDVCVAQIGGDAAASTLPAALAAPCVLGAVCA